MKRFFLQIQTTGLLAREHQVIQVEFLSWDGLHRHCFSMQPTKKVDPQSLLISGFEIEDLDSFPKRAEGLAHLRDFLTETFGEDKELQFFVYVGEFFSSFWHALLGELFPLDSTAAIKFPYVVSIIDFVKDYLDKEGLSLADTKKETVCSVLLSKPYEGLNELRELARFIESWGIAFPKGSPILEGLNDSQKQAVTHSDGALLVLAGAGSGKTRVIISKILYAIQHLGIPPSRILAVTFTNKAAREMQERLEKHLSKSQIRELAVCTFHALGLRILKEEYEIGGYAKEFSIFGESDKEALVRDVLLELRIPEDEVDIPGAKRLISNKKSRKESGSAFPYEEEIFRLYEDKLASSAGFDFDDLIYKPILLMKKHEEIWNKWSNTFQVILVDEYQDTNETQFCMLQELSVGFGNLCVVGDDDQSIYAFRGADVGHILSFEKNFPNANRILLDYNYRNAPHILEAAMALIANNKNRYEKKIFSGRKGIEENAKISYFEAQDAEGEAEWIASEIFANRIDRGVPYSEQAILCRTNLQMRVLERGLRQENIPYRILGGFSFFDRAEVKTVFAYLRLLYNPQDNQAFYRAVQFPKRGVGEKTLQLLSEFAIRKNMGLLQACMFVSEIEGMKQGVRNQLSDFSDLYWRYRNLLESQGVSLDKVVEDLYVQSGIQEELLRVYEDEADKRLRSLQEILDDIRRKGKKKSSDIDGHVLLGQFLQECMLSQSKDEDEETPKVLLITIHSAKGLEFRSVFIPGFQEGIFPHDKSLKSDRDRLSENGILEERRLCYVAFTRAKDFLFLSMYKEKSSGGDGSIIHPSRFLDEIPQGLINTSQEDEVDDMIYLQKMREVLQYKE